MKKIVIGLIAVVVFFTSVSSFAFAQTVQFNVDLKLKSSNYSEVVKLQKFLMVQGFLKSKIADGIFGPGTRNAVIAFQKKNNLKKADGIFGPFSRSVASQLASANAATPIQAKVSVQSISNQPNPLAASVISYNDKVITWTTSGYTPNVGVNINLLRKSSDTPISYKLVRIIAQDTPNDGREVWTPLSGENTNDLYVEVTCSSTYKFEQGCESLSTPIPVN